MGSDVSDKTNRKLCRGRRLVRAALKSATQLLDTGGLFVWEWLGGCQACELPEMKMFQTRCGNQLLYYDLDACELGVRGETTRMVRKEWTFMTNSESLHRICKHAWPKETHSDIYPVKLYRRAVHQILKMERRNLVQHALQQTALTQSINRGSREFE